jgi:hypothetical protein
MRTPLALTAALLALPLAVSAESFRCGKWIVSADLAPEEILQKCGEPTARASATEDVLVRNQFGLMVKVGETTKETWTYARGKDPSMVVVIVDGRVKSLERQE